MKYNLTLSVDIEYEFKNIEAKDRDEAELIAIRMFKEICPFDFDEDEAFARFK